MTALLSILLYILVAFLTKLQRKQFLLVFS